MPPTEFMTIGQVAASSGTPATTLRYYERRGLIDAPDRVGGQRRYRPTVLRRLMLIRFCRIAGLGLDDIAEVVADVGPGRTTTKEIAARQLEVIDARLDELRLARRMMAAASSCSCDDVEHCDCGAMSDVLDELRTHLGDASASPGEAT